MAPHRYTVTAYCRAVVKETWKVTSPTPLNEADITDMLTGGSWPDDVICECTDEDVSDEEDREVTDVREETVGEAPPGFIWVVTGIAHGQEATISRHRGATADDAVADAQRYLTREGWDVDGWQWRTTLQTRQEER